MVRALTDENFNEHLLRALLRDESAWDIVRVVDVGLRSRDDSVILEFAAAEQRLLLTHDLKTMPTHACNRLAQDLPMWCVIVVDERSSMADALTDLELVAGCAIGEEWRGNIWFIPFP
ncbi:MAG TPA: DUF5615 family PIN-like protein [Planctomycetota bacterium]|jgi:hypothetical protein